MLRTDGVQGHAAEPREELADRGFARAGLTHEQHGFGVREAAADEPVYFTWQGVCFFGG